MEDGEIGTEFGGGGIMPFAASGKEIMRQSHFIVGCRINGKIKQFKDKESAVKFIDAILEGAKAEGGPELVDHVKKHTDLIRVTVEARPVPLSGVEPSQQTEGKSAADFIAGLTVKEKGEKPK